MLEGCRGAAETGEQAVAALGRIEETTIAEAAGLGHRAESDGLYIGQPEVGEELGKVLLEQRCLGLVFGQLPDHAAQSVGQA
ncbi:MAG: hypothetical protein IPL39_09620 [Opitutaceae bacterium]|nr:hypothetical protein [Opitutaceae bacterium]